jgi:hypothetical protein
MDADEREIYYFLKPYRNEFLSGREICRRAGGKQRYRYEETWALPPLMRMVERGILETDPSGAYRIKPRFDDKGKLQRWISPQITRVLRDSEKNFDGIIEIDEDELDAYYDSL